MVKLSGVEREILACGAMQARASVSELAKQLGYREHKVRYALERLSQEKLIRRFPVVNVYAFGFTDYGIFYRSSAESAEKYKSLTSHLVQSSKVPWISIMGGDYQYAFSLIAKHISEIDLFLTEIGQNHGGQILEQVISIRIAWSFFPLKHFAKVDPPIKFLNCGGAPDVFHPDEVDLSILHSIANPDLWNVRELARKLGLPKTTISYRLKRLEKSGVIVGYAFGVNTQAVGLQEFRLLVVVQGCKKGFNEKFHLFCLEHPLIVRYTRCLGPWSFEVCLQVHNAREVIPVSQEITERFGDAVREIKVLSELECLKRIPFPPLEDFRY